MRSGQVVFKIDSEGVYLLPIFVIVFKSFSFYLHLTLVNALNYYVNVNMLDVNMPLIMKLKMEMRVKMSVIAIFIIMKIFFFIDFTSYELNHFFVYQPYCNQFFCCQISQFHH